MKHNRWYDNNNKLKTIMESLQSFDQAAINAFAVDVIQFSINKQADKDNFLELLLDNEICSSRERWYDCNSILRSAIEMLKFLPEEEVEQLFKDAVISMMCECGYKNENLPWE